ncbi:MAG: hypothetical protein WCK34_01570 [Bacteroidota bacterium]
MKTCATCILDDRYPGLTFTEKGECEFCDKYQKFSPIGEQQLVSAFDNARGIARRRKLDYDVLVPLSGGKDSTYMLYLAARKYKLRVLAMTYDNGFLSPLALKNISTTVKNAGAHHIFHRTDPAILQKVYRIMFRYTGDICGACDIGTNNSILKVSHDYKLPLIISGVSPLENDSFVPDSVQDISRFRYVMKKLGSISSGEINNFLIYPNLNYFTQTLLKRTGYFGRLIFPLFYIENPMDKEMGAIISNELGWEDARTSEYTKHFDCIAEPFTNFARNRIYGYERRICQYSNMIRRGEISREHGLEMMEKDNLWEIPANAQHVMEYLDVTEEGLAKVFEYKPLTYENHTSRMNHLFGTLKKVKEKIIH